MHKSVLSKRQKSTSITLDIKMLNGVVLTRYVDDCFKCFLASAVPVNNENRTDGQRAFIPDCVGSISLC